MANAQFSFFTSPLLLYVLSTLILLATPQRLIPNTTTDNERTVLNGLLRIGYINETVLPWNSGRPLLIRYIWGINTNNGNEIFAFEVL
ncbi:Uncharacterized protein BM_BM17360 [Brugia malayi]|uniref:Uncharacterized protein n=1 Tax=Brugia malayi TaxID=6279 RepID=A0A4E9F3P5_BRUMA|nr:Uncharacterized protein BM_BM17360 [Brugia malayi]VIO90715.1 Uncharacterized protein BM_BM17360 [Brugia malayi]